MAPRHISREIKEAALKMSQEGASDELIKQYLGISEQAMRPFFFFFFFLFFFTKKYRKSRQICRWGFPKPRLATNNIGVAARSENSCNILYLSY